MNLKFSFRYPLFAAILALFSVPVLADSPTSKPNESWISVNGTVVDTSDDSFQLDYGEGLITVEVDDWDWYGEGAVLLNGDQVSVLGRVDDDLYEKRTIEASSVYVTGIGTYFDASAADEEQIDPMISSQLSTNPPIGEGSWITLTGRVQNVDGRELTVDSGGTAIIVDTSAMSYNPLDEVGFQQIEAGDFVSVSGTLEVELFDGNQLEAESITSIES